VFHRHPTGAQPSPLDIELSTLTLLDENFLRFCCLTEAGWASSGLAQTLLARKSLRRGRSMTPKNARTLTFHTFERDYASALLCDGTASTRQISVGPVRAAKGPL
jgi:hypothetical protein